MQLPVVRNEGLCLHCHKPLVRDPDGLLLCPRTVQVWGIMRAAAAAADFHQQLGVVMHHQDVSISRPRSVKGPGAPIRDWKTARSVSVAQFKRIAAERRERERERYKRLEEERAAGGLFELPKH